MRFPTGTDQTIASWGPRLQPGQKVFGARFLLDRCLENDPSGEVWLAGDVELGGKRELKFLPEEVSSDPSSLAQLKRQAVAGRRLTHPRIVRVDEFHAEGELVAVSREHVEGNSLADLIEAEPRKHFEVSDIKGWVNDICEALEYAHAEAKVVHRDLRPEQVLIDAASGRAKVADFGLSKRILETRSRLTGRQDEQSLPYGSPQVLMGERGTPSDDLYALGALIYHLLTGRPPFWRGDVTAQILNAAPLRMAERRREFVAGGAYDASGVEIPEAWERAVAACLDKRPENRPKDVKAFRQLLACGMTPSAKAAPAREASSAKPLPPFPGGTGTSGTAAAKNVAPAATPMAAIRNERPGGGDPAAAAEVARMESGWPTRRWLAAASLILLALVSVGWWKVASDGDSERKWSARLQQMEERLGESERRNAEELAKLRQEQERDERSGRAPSSGQADKLAQLEAEQKRLEEDRKRLEMEKQEAARIKRDADDKAAAAAAAAKREEEQRIDKERQALRERREREAKQLVSDYLSACDQADESSLRRHLATDVRYLNSRGLDAAVAEIAGYAKEFSTRKSTMSRSDMEVEMPGSGDRAKVTGWMDFSHGGELITFKGRVKNEIGISWDKAGNPHIESVRELQRSATSTVFDQTGQKKQVESLLRDYYSAAAWSGGNVDIPDQIRFLSPQVSYFTYKGREEARKDLRRYREGLRNKGESVRFGAWKATLRNLGSEAVTVELEIDCTKTSRDGSRDAFKIKNRVTVGFRKENDWKPWIEVIGQM